MSRSKHKIRRYVGEKLANAQQAAWKARRASVAAVDVWIEAALGRPEQEVR